MSNSAKDLSSYAASSEQELGQYIPLHYHYQMLLDQARMKGFKEALTQFVPPKGKVVDLGGGTGVLSFFAAQKASKVWCVERNPELAATAERLIKKNSRADVIEVVNQDAGQFCPPEPVDVVVCEMLHSALLREKQIQVLEAFKKNYFARFPNSTPKFIPEATILAFQPVEQAFNFNGYEADIPVFFEPYSDQSSTRTLTDPVVYNMFEYRKDLPQIFTYTGETSCASRGVCNALRFVTKNILGVLLDTHTTIDWHNFYLVLPLKTPIKVEPGTRLKISFTYRPGDQLSTLSNSLECQEM